MYKLFCPLNSVACFLFQLSENSNKTDRKLKNLIFPEIRKQNDVRNSKSIFFENLSFTVNFSIIFGVDDVIKILLADL